MTSLRCGNLADHDAHDWEGRRQPWQPVRTYTCTGRVLTSLAERAYGAAADRGEAS